MASDATSEISARVAELEREVERLKKQLTPEELRIRSPDGTCETVVRGNGLVVFEAGQARIALHLADDMPRLTLLDRAGSPRVGIDADAGAAGVRLFDRRGNDRLVLQVTEDNPGFYLQEADGTRRVELDVVGVAVLCLNDSKGAASLQFSVSEDGSAVATLPNGQGVA